ncbi:MAG: hypothetical protein DMG74_15080 [Acidobacteria bacterium]|nr:MAG: hypothetical protein DMG74_15080 [Acidobacteriota bacterium]
MARMMGGNGSVGRNITVAYPALDSILLKFHPETDRSLWQRLLGLLDLHSVVANIDNLFCEYVRQVPTTEGTGCIELASFEDFVVMVRDGERSSPGVVFFPMHRVERMEMDLPDGSIPSLSQRFAAKTGVDPAVLLCAEYLTKGGPKGDPA